MRKVVPAALAVLAAALVVLAGFQPEFVIGTESPAPIGVVPLEGGRPAWLATLATFIVHAGVLLVAALMLLLDEARRVAGGLLLGASLIGLSLRLARVLQLSAAPDYAPAAGSWVDLGAEVVALAAGVWALAALRTAGSKAPDPVGAGRTPGLS